MPKQCHTVLRQLGIFLEVGLAFFEESLASLLRLIKEIIEHGAVASQFLYASLTVKFSIQSSLYHSDGDRAALHYCLCPINNLVLEFVERNNFIYKSHFKSLLSGVEFAEIPNFACLLLAYDACKI